jgi:hypothetical protein
MSDLIEEVQKRVFQLCCDGLVFAARSQRMNLRRTGWDTMFRSTRAEKQRNMRFVLGELWYDADQCP